MNKYIKLSIATIIGGALGFVYSNYFACNGPSCAIMANWYTATLFGAAFGFIAGFPSKPEKKTNENTGN